MKRWAWVLAVALLAMVSGAVGAEAQENAETPEAAETATVNAVAEAEAKLAAGDPDGAIKTLEGGMAAPGAAGGEAALRLGILRASRGELDNAIDAYVAAAEKLESAGKGEALGRVAVVQYTRAMAGAGASAEAAVAADPEGVWPTIAMSYRDVHEGEVDEGVALARKAVAADGGAAAEGALGYALQAKGDMAGAETAYRAAMAADETLMGPVIGLASVLRATDRAAEAEPLLSRVLEASPGAVEAYKESARVKIALNRAGEALGDASIAAAMAENDPSAQALVLEVKVARALQELRGGNQALAEQDLTQLRGENPDSPEVRLGLARAQLERGDVDAAIVELTKTTELDPENAEAHFELGQVQLKRKADPAAAVSPLEKAASLDPGSATYLTAYGTALVGAQEFDKAVETLTTATALPGYKSAEGLFSLGQALVQLKKYTDAIPVLEKASALAPDAAPIWATLAWAHFGLKDADNFKKAAAKAKGLGYAEPTLLNYLQELSKPDAVIR
jgi:tetratricopeptide (TPR) repeat protein